MLSIVGVLITCVCVFGGYIMSGGKLEVVLEALPHELLEIFGAAIGAMVVSNSMDVVKGVLKSVGVVLKGNKWKKDDYRDLLCLLFELTKLMKTKGPVAVEPHIEKPDDSPIFGKYPKIGHDHYACPFLCDTVRIMMMDIKDPHQLDDIMEKQLEKHHHEEMLPAGAIQNMADGLPALGIVAAVLGVIKTMSSINEPPAILGKMIGGALTGTFLGVFLAYGIVGPLATRLKQLHDEDYQFMKTISNTLTAYLHGNAIQVAVEIGRGAVPSKIQPTFFDLDNALGEVKT